MSDLILYIVVIVWYYLIKFILSAFVIGVVITWTQAIAVMLMMIMVIRWLLKSGGSK